MDGMRREVACVENGSMDSWAAKPGITLVGTTSGAAGWDL